MLVSGDVGRQRWRPAVRPPPRRNHPRRSTQAGPDLEPRSPPSPLQTNSDLTSCPWHAMHAWRARIARTARIGDDRVVCSPSVEPLRRSPRDADCNPQREDLRQSRVVQIGSDGGGGRGTGPGAARVSRRPNQSRRCPTWCAAAPPTLLSTRLHFSGMGVGTRGRGDVLGHRQVQRTGLKALCSSADPGDPHTFFARPGLFMRARRLPFF